MTDERQTAQAGARPSKLAITRMLAEVEVRRRRAVKLSLLGLLLPLAVGAALLVYIVVTVGRKLEENRRLDDEIAAKREEVKGLEQQKAELESQKASLAGTAKAVEFAVSEGAKNGESAKEVAEKVRNAIAANPVVAEAVPFVYVQIHDEPQRRQEARAAADALRRAGFDVKGVERVPSVTVPATEVRYFRAEDKALAERAVGALNDAKLPTAGCNLSKSRDAKPGQIEVWLAPGTGGAAQGGPPGQVTTPEQGGEQQVTKQGNVVVLREVQTREEAFKYAQDLRQKKIPAEVYAQRDGRFYVTLGGYVSGQKARDLLSEARQNVFGGARLSAHAVGGNLLP